MKCKAVSGDSVKHIFRIIVLFISVTIFTVFLCFLSRNIKVTLVYDIYENTNPEGLVTLYYDNGNGFEEKDSVYETIQEAYAEFTFRPISRLHGLRFIPTRIEGQAISIKSFSLYVDGSLMKTFSGRELYHYISVEKSAAYTQPIQESLVVDYNEDEPWAYIEFSPLILPLANRLSAGTYVRISLVLFLLYFPITVSKINYMLFRQWVMEIASPSTAFLWRIAIALILLWLFQKSLNIPFFWFCWIFPFIFGLPKERKENTISIVLSLITLLFATLFLVFSAENTFIGCSVSSDGIDIICIIFVAWIGTLSIQRFLFITETVCTREKISPINDVIYAFSLICISFLLYECIKRNFTHPSFRVDFWSDILNRMTSPVYLMNIFWGTTFFLFLLELLGRGLSTLLYGIIWIVLCIGNAIKIHYHNTLLTPMDFLQLEEMFRISSTILGKKIYLIITVFILVILLLSLSRKLWVPLLKPSIQWKYAVFFGLVCISMACTVIQGGYVEKNIFYKGYENEFINERDDGVAFYNLINLSKISEVYMKTPADYTLEKVNQLKNQFSSITDNSWGQDELPNVILIMAESLFDIEKIEGLSFNEPIEPTLRQYKTGELLSPRFGGYTSAIEYEALTGLTLAFYPPALTPYTTYFNQPQKTIPSIASEFKKNGYQTYAIHPNDKTFYNRDIAYQMFGFDSFLDKTSFPLTTSNTVANSFLRDMPIAEKIIDLISESDEPKFIFAVTIAGHYMSEDRFPDTTITAQSSEMTETELYEIAQAATAFQETDTMFQYLVDYIQSDSRPTLLYIFGDHLPPFPIFNKINYTQDRYNKYGTTLSAYSNYKEIVTPEYITPNQLATQLIYDSQIRHSSYYDYIFSLRKNYPVVHSEFIKVDNNKDLDTYRLIQYDVMFGEQWFFDEE